jgi:hypothetical protein
MIQNRLRIVSLRAGVQWGVFLGAVAVFALLILVETFWVWSGAYAVLLIVIGLNIGTSWWEEAITPPVSFTLPGYREPWRRSRFASAIRWGTVLSLFLFSNLWWDLVDQRPASA